jgi:sterol-4alpha-carboxylate 3-dehydrogenase (decarboxylating)
MTDEKQQHHQNPSLGRVLVVGGNGFLGHHIVRKARDEWAATAVISVDLRCVHNRLDGGGVEYREVDITDLDALSKVFEEARPDVVIHTASPAAQSDSIGSHQLMYRVNVTGTTNVVEASRRAGAKALVFTSSASVLSDTRSDLKNADERWPVVRGALQVEYYSETKVRIAMGA